MAPFVLGSIVYDHSRSTQKRRFGSRLEIICSYSIGNLQVEMGMGINKARKKQFSGYIYDLCRTILDIFFYPADLFVFNQHIQLF